MGDLYWLTEEQMARLDPYFPKNHGTPRVDDRRVLSGIIFVNRNELRVGVTIVKHKVQAASAIDGCEAPSVPQPVPH